MSERVWFYVEGGAQQGPLTREELKEALRARLPPVTLVWRNGFPDWLRAADVTELQDAPRVAPPPPPRTMPPRPPTSARPAWSPTAAAPVRRPATWGEEEPTYNPFVLWRRCFSWSGRFDRGEFAVAYFAQLLVTIGIVVLNFIVTFLPGGGRDGGPGGSIAGTVIAVLFMGWMGLAFVLALGAIVRRLHDLGQTGWLALLMIVPCLNLAFLIYLLAAPGKEAGEAAAPSGTPVALIVAIAVAVLAVPMIGIIAAIAIPSLLRARVSANESMAIGDLRTVVSAQAAYQSSNRGFYEGRGECLSRPAECVPGYNGPSFLDPQTLQSPKNGYVRALRPGTPVEPGVTGVSPTSTYGFAIVAYPLQAGRTGVRAFCADGSGRVCFAVSGDASTLVEEDTQAGGVRCSSSCTPLN